MFAIMHPDLSLGWYISTEPSDVQPPDRQPPDIIITAKTVKEKRKYLIFILLLTTNQWENFVKNKFLREFNGNFNGNFPS